MAPGHNAAAVLCLEHLGKPLEDYVAKLDKVKILRAEKREGLIR